MHILLAVAVIGLGVAWLYWRVSNQLWTLTIADGRVTDIDGQPPIRFVQAAREIVAHPPVRRGTITAHRAEQGVVLSTTGVDDGRRQRLNNVLRLQPQASLRSGPSPVNQRTFWRIWNAAWLLRLLGAFRSRP